MALHMRRLALALLAIAIATPAAYAQAPGKAASEALDGLDPVLLVKGQEVFGKDTLTVTRGRFMYSFATIENKAEFERNPAPYEIQLGGLCARMGGTAGGNGNSFAVHEGKIYVFGSDDCRKRFVAAPAKFIAPAAPALPTDADAARRGTALIARAVEAVGGATVLDGMTTYVESATYTTDSQMGPATVAQVTSRRLADGATRIDRTMTMGNATRESATVSNQAEAFFAAQGRVFPMLDAARPNLAAQLARHPVMLLRARGQRDFKAAALGSGTAGTTPVEFVGVRLGGEPGKSAGVVATLGIDPKTGRVMSLSYVDRDTEGAFGTIALVYSDFRPVGGLTLPFAGQGSVEGKLEPALSLTMTSIDVNRPLDASLFQRPAEGQP